jgi:hypothetical protein
LPAFDEPKVFAGWKPALRQRPKTFFIGPLEVAEKNYRHVTVSLTKKGSADLIS